MFRTIFILLSFIFIIGCSPSQIYVGSSLRHIQVKKQEYKLFSYYLINSSNNKVVSEWLIVTQGDLPITISYYSQKFASVKVGKYSSIKCPCGVISLFNQKKQKFVELGKISEIKGNKIETYMIQKLERVSTGSGAVNFDKLSSESAKN